MALGSSPYTSVPNGISTPAMPPSPQDAAAMMGSQGIVPPGAHMAPPGAPGPGDQLGAGGQGPSQLDLFQRVAFLIMQNTQLWLPVFAGMGLARALEKSGKQDSNPHRSNEELAGQGIPVGNPGQTGIKDPAEMAKGLGGMPGYA